MSGSLVLLVGIVFGLYVLLSIEAIFTALFLNLDYCHRPTKNRESDVPLAALEAEKVETSKETAEVGLVQTSVHTHTDEDTFRHLEQVYDAQEHLHLGKAEEEDRMPTILFDDEMAKQLTKTEENMRQQQQKTNNPTDNGPESIKISDKPL